MKIDNKINELPLSKSNPNTLKTIFGKSEITPMWIADMDFQTAKPIQDALMKRILNSGFAYEYKPDSFFLALQNWYQDRYKLDISKSDIVFSPSITTSLAILLEKFTEDGDGVIIQPPVFMGFKDVIRKMGRRVITNPLKLIDNYYEINFDDLREKAKASRSKVLIICNPHNPVGRVWRKDELEQIIMICKENDLLLISDEIHKDIILFDNQFTSVLSYQDRYENMVVCTSEAKSFNLCSISDSMIIIPNEDIRNSISNILKRYNLGSTNALTRVALEAAYVNGGPWLKKVVETVEKNVKIIESELSNSRINLIKPEGTYQVWLDFRNVFDDTKEMFNSITEHSGIGMNAGHWFGREGALFMRMNIAASTEKVIDSINRIKTI